MIAGAGTGAGAGVLVAIAVFAGLMLRIGWQISARIHNAVHCCKGLRHHHQRGDQPGKNGVAVGQYKHKQQDNATGLLHAGRVRQAVVKTIRVIMNDRKFSLNHHRLHAVFDGRFGTHFHHAFRPAGRTERTG